MADKLWYEFELVCDGCPTSIKINSTVKRDQTDAMAEALGWTTRDKGKETLIFCVECQKQAELIINGK
jgi:hypothetical protein